MSELIDRQAAIDMIEKYFDGLPIAVHHDMLAMIHRLPSVQQEIIRCKDCKHKHIENMVWTCPFGLPGGENFFCGYGAEP